jgi:hypothetical protein
VGSVIVTNVLDTHVAQDAPNTNYNAGGSLYVRQWAGSIRVAYLYFSRPFPLGVNITSAKLHVYGYAKPVAGTIELYVRRLNQTISLPKVTWDTRATAFAYPEVTASKTGTYADREEWEFDIMPLMDALAGGAKWYGLQLGSDWVTETWSPRFMAANHPNPDLRPWVEIEWSDAPDTPTQLSPAGGRVISTPQPILRCDYKDVSGSTQLGEVQVQISTTASFVAPLYDSGEQAADGPQWDLTGSAFTATAGTTYYWRVRVADEANLWSGWSAAAPFVYRPLPTLTIDTPAVAPNDFVEEPTPPVFWTASDQAAYQLGFYRRVGDRDTLLWSRAKTAGTTDGFVVPAGLITVKDATYRVDVRVYDAYEREAVPNGPAYTQLSRYFTYEFSALTSPVTALTAVGADPYPGVTLEWDRATAPDSYSVIRDGVVIAAGLDPDDDTFVSGIHYAWTDRFPVKGRAHTYSVQAVVNGKASASNPTAVEANYFRGTWLVDATPDGPMVMLVNDKDRTLEFGEQSEIFEPLGASKVIVVTQGMQGYQGEISGELRSDVGITETVEELRDALLDLKEEAGQLVYLLLTRTTMPVVLQKVQCAPMVNAEPAYAVRFNYYQQGDLAYTPRV